MDDRGKTKEQLINELVEMRQQVALLEQTRAAKNHVEQTLKNTEEILRLILNLSTNFSILSSNEIHEGIDDVMKIVGEFVGVDRSCMFEFSDDGRTVQNTHEWCGLGIDPLIKNRQSIPVSKLPSFIQPIWDLEVVNISDLPKITRKNKGKNKLAQSIIAIPLVYNISLMGFLGFESIHKKKVWSESTVSLLKIVGETFTSALMRKRTEDSLRESESHFRNIFDYAVEGIFQSTLDDRYKSVNPAFARTLGYESPEEVLNTITNISRQLYVNPESYQTLKALLSERGFVEGYETEFYKKDGSKIWVAINARAVRNGNGSIDFFEGFHQDITRRKRAENDLKNTVESLKKTLDGTVHALSTTLEMRDPYTAGHQKRVALIACEIAEEMGLPEEQIEGIRVMGFLHDIGKIMVPAEILSKPGKINEYEFHIIKAHSQVGYDILKGIELPWPVALATIQHHERIDGSGYPQGLKGDEIILEAKILAVADVLEAMASHRPYRPALGLDKALEEIREKKGVYYDPVVVDACLRLFVDKGFRYE
ncbi:MAG TPA: HD domain-containing protein [Syntrophorhabdus sp.]|jgi:PAS domain S-box-containing protein/putative nucleotidyltransferase with HDIG domain|nr:HD domain-containing protein [Syntrophorhabdus sp.]MDI9558501.1 HD domain-containing protein [Pseudomonadota bacterium]OPX93483.1 MAG: Cyclic di-GMP phosphodiesterase response regulator RpfG [Syntrophorhabdus sp. PtaB.Bin027]OQB75916.1 MAG: Cyclic di-GMP phosphodiesterase response regulator RpfG [Deltaproteobacteria bacterium ADurb.Bin135]MBP8745338.1 HD domain-containing protein [Syntrophorhabdus sp.]